MNKMFDFSNYIDEKDGNKIIEVNNVEVLKPESSFGRNISSNMVNSSMGSSFAMSAISKGAIVNLVGGIVSTIGNVITSFNEVRIEKEITKRVKYQTEAYISMQEQETKRFVAHEKEETKRLRLNLVSEYKKSKTDLIKFNKQIEIELKKIDANEKGLEKILDTNINVINEILYTIQKTNKYLIDRWEIGFSVDQQTINYIQSLNSQVVNLIKELNKLR